MKKVQINFFGKEQELYYNIERIMHLENMTKQSIGSLIKNQDLDFNTLTALLVVGLKQDGLRDQKYFAARLQEALDNGFEIIDIQTAIIKALAGSGIMGKEAKAALFPEEVTEEDKKEIAAEKN